MATSSLMQKLKYFNMMTGMSLINDEEKAVILATEAGLLPKKEEAPPCPKCGHKMNANSRKEAKLGWRWICSNRNRGKCPGMVNPVAGTFFEGTKVPVRECMVFIFLFVLEMNFTFIKMNFMSWRKEQKLPEIRDETICDFMSYCREICEVFASHHSTQLGGAGKTILVDETFLTKRKYNRGRVTKNMTITVLGIYCREDKEGLFFRVNGKSKRDIWPYIKHHVHPETSVICTDSAKQYKNVESMFSGAVHKTTNHSKGN
ncbi:uncharacterized protein LOC118199635 [Stegodyphus dumicola]|uniref:uncharacterized protein LOC118199635 n=1 Tax=Stegodyphus dumicola TaxID=202533 RepID=UPI0015B1BEEA|nr:uncharacterized protein LOC118199635 [Stegodyphus dumicola]